MQHQLQKTSPHSVLIPLGFSSSPNNPSFPTPTLFLPYPDPIIPFPSQQPTPNLPPCLSKKRERRRETFSDRRPAKKNPFHSNTAIFLLYFIQILFHGHSPLVAKLTGPSEAALSSCLRGAPLSSSTSPAAMRTKKHSESRSLVIGSLESGLVKVREAARAKRAYRRPSSDENYTFIRKLKKCGKRM